MNVSANLMKELPELPIELFELGAKFDFSKTAPVLTNHPDAVKSGRQPVSTPRINKSSHQTRTWYGWALYPKVICYPLPDLVAFSALELDRAKPDPRADQADLGAVASARRYYKLSGFRGIETAFCEVRYGPWFAKVSEQESCDDQIPNAWQLESHDPGIMMSWLGTWADRPSVPNLTIIVNLNDVAKVSSDCCGGFTYCPTTQSCVPNAINCPDAHPV